MVLDTRINTYTTNSQQRPSVTALTDGGFVVTWESDGQDGSTTGIYGQRYDNSGNPRGAEFRVDSYYYAVINISPSPSVTGLADGGFVVTWDSTAPGGIGIYGRRYDASGNPQGAEFHVNSRNTSSDFSSSVTALTDGGFVVTWNYDDDIYGQRYDASGNEQGNEFLVFSARYLSALNYGSSVTALTDGGFVVTWTTHYGAFDETHMIVYGQRYDANGNKQSEVFRASSSDTFAGDPFAGDPSVIALTDGGFVVTWDATWNIYIQDWVVHGQRYNASGYAQGAEFLVNSGTTNALHSSSTPLTDGGFVVTWMAYSIHDGSDGGIRGQRYDASGNKQGAEFRISSGTTNIVNFPSATTLTDGGFVVTWHSNNAEDSLYYDIYGKRFDANGNEVEWVGTYNPEPEDPDGKTASEIFVSVLSDEEKKIDGAEEVGMIRVMADFSKAAYHLETHEKDIVFNDAPNKNADLAFGEVKDQKWQPLDLNYLPHLPLERGAFSYIIHEGLLGSNGLGVSNVENGLSNGFYNHDNAAAFVARAGDAVVISFRGTNDNDEKYPNDEGNKIHPDADEWGAILDGSTGAMTEHYDLLRPLLDSVDAYIAVHDIKKVYVTGHSLGGAMAIEYMDNHPDTTVTYSAITFAAPAFTIINAWRKEFDDDGRITQIEISEDPVPQTWDVEVVINSFNNNRPGDVIRFAGNETLDQPDWMKLFYANKANHSMDYYRQIVDRIDASSWLRILDEPGDQTVFLGGRQDGDNFFVDEERDVLKDTDLDQEDFDQIGDDDIEIFYGGRGDDELTGGNSDELMLGGSGNDSIDGNGGIDTAAYSGARTNYTLQLNERLFFADQRIVTDQRTGIDNDGVDTLENVERLIFTDSGIAFDLNDSGGNAGKVAKLIGAVFGAGSVSKADYVAIGLYYLDTGTSYEDLAAGAISIAGAKSPEEVVSLLWNNVVGSLPTADQIQSVLDDLGTSIGELGVYAAEYSLNQTNINLVGLAENGIVFDPLHYQPIG